MGNRLVCSKRPTRQASFASSKAPIAALWEHRSVLNNFPQQALEGKFANQKEVQWTSANSSFRVPPCRPVTMRFLQPSSRGRTLASGLCSPSLSECFPTGGLANRLLYTSHSVETSFVTSFSGWSRRPRDGTGIREHGGAEEAVNTLQFLMKPFVCLQIMHYHLLYN